MTTTYHTQGTCSTAIHIDIDEATHIIRQIRFERGCQGNTAGIAALVKGMKVEDVIARLQGLHCGPRPTSCPDQLARALVALLPTLSPQP